MQNGSRSGLAVTILFSLVVHSACQSPEALDDYVSDRQVSFLTSEVLSLEFPATEVLNATDSLFSIDWNMTPVEQMSFGLFANYRLPKSDFAGKPVQSLENVNFHFRIYRLPTEDSRDSIANNLCSLVKDKSPFNHQWVELMDQEMVYFITSSQESFLLAENFLWELHVELREGLTLLVFRDLISYSKSLSDSNQHPQMTNLMKTFEC